MSVQALRRQLAAALRWACRLDFHEGVLNHFSVAVPGDQERYLFNPQGVHWSEMTASSIVEVDGEGNAISGSGRISPTALHLHVQCHRSKPSARCIMHTHMRHAAALSCIDDGRLRFVHQNSLRFYGRVAYDREFHGLALAEDEGRRFGEVLRSADITFMQNHGVMVCGSSIARAFDDLYYLEKACEVQILSAKPGDPVSEIEETEARNCAQQLQSLADAESAQHFAALERILAREEPDYLN